MDELSLTNVETLIEKVGDSIRNNRMEDKCFDELAACTREDSKRQILKQNKAFLTLLVDYCVHLLRKNNSNYIDYFYRICGNLCIDDDDFREFLFKYKTLIEQLVCFVNEENCENKKMLYLGVLYNLSLNNEKITNSKYFENNVIAKLLNEKSVLNKTILRITLNYLELTKTQNVKIDMIVDVLKLDETYKDQELLELILDIIELDVLKNKASVKKYDILLAVINRDLNKELKSSIYRTMSMLLENDENIKLNENRDIIMKIVEYSNVSIYKNEVLSCAYICLGNIARNDENCHFLIKETDVLSQIKNYFEKIEETDINKNLVVLHSMTGLLKNLTHCNKMPKEYMCGLVIKKLNCIITTSSEANEPLVYNTIGIIKNVISDECVLDMFRKEGLPTNIVKLIRKSNRKDVKIEATRVLCKIIKCYNKNLEEYGIGNNEIINLITENLMNEEFLVLLNEAINTLIVIMSTKNNDQKTENELIKRITINRIKNINQINVLSNALNLLKIIATKLDSKEINQVEEKINSFKQCGNDKIKNDCIKLFSEVCEL